MLPKHARRTWCLVLPAYCLRRDVQGLWSRLRRTSHSGSSVTYETFYSQSEVPSEGKAAIGGNSIFMCPLAVIFHPLLLRMFIFEINEETTASCQFFVFLFFFTCTQCQLYVDALCKAGCTGVSSKLELKNNEAPARCVHRRWSRNWLPVTKSLTAFLTFSPRTSGTLSAFFLYIRTGDLEICFLPFICSCFLGWSYEVFATDLPLVSL